MAVRGPQAAQSRALVGRRRWAALPRRYRRHGWSLTGLFPAYAQALLTGPHRPAAKGEGQTRIVEAFNCSLRQPCGVLVRRSCSFSKSRPTHAARIKICIDQQNQKTVLTYTPAQKPRDIFVSFFVLPEVYLSPYLLFWCMYSEGA